MPKLEDDAMEFALSIRERYMEMLRQCEDAGQGISNNTIGHVVEINDQERLEGVSGSIKCIDSVLNNAEKEIVNHIRRR